MKIAKWDKFSKRDLLAILYHKPNFFKCKKTQNTYIYNYEFDYLESSFDSNFIWFEEKSSQDHEQYYLIVYGKIVLTSVEQNSVWFFSLRYFNV